MKKLLSICILVVCGEANFAFCDVPQYKTIESEAATSLLEYKRLRMLLEQGNVEKALEKINDHIAYRESVLEAIRIEHGLSEQTKRVLENESKK